MNRGRETVLVVASHVPVLLVRIARAALGTLLRIRRGRRIFRRTLRAEGIESGLARRLARVYGSGLSLRKMIRWPLREIR